MKFFYSFNYSIGTMFKIILFMWKIYTKNMQYLLHPAKKKHTLIRSCMKTLSDATYVEVTQSLERF